MPTIADIKKQYPDLGALDDNQVVDALHQAFYGDLPRDQVASALGVQPTLKPEKPRTWGDAFKDTGAALMQSGAGLVKSAGDLYGVVSGDMANPVSQLGNSAQEYWQDAKSDPLKKKMAERDADIKAQDGVAGKAWTAFKDTVTDPALAMDTLAGNAATLLPGAAVGRGVAGAITARSLAMGPVTEAASIAAAKAAGKYGTASAIAAGGVQQGADVSGQVYEDAMKKPDEVWDTNPDFVAKVKAMGGNTPENRQAVKNDLATISARMTFPAATGISLAANSIPGADMLERALVGGVAKDTIKAGAKYGLPKAIAKAAAGEAAQEFTEEGGGQFVGNVANRSYVDPNQDLTNQVGENAGMGAAGGFLMGAGGGVFHKPQHVEEKGPLSRAANTGIDAAPPIPPAPPPPAPLLPEQEQTLLDHANERARVLAEKENGTKDQKITAPDGTPVTIPSQPKQFLTPADKQERDFLAENGGDAQALATVYPVQTSPETASALEQVPNNTQPAAAELTPATPVVPVVPASPLASPADLPISAITAFDQREIDRPSPPTRTVMDGDILNKQGVPFKTMPAAMTAQKKAGDSHEIVRVAGGLVVRAKNPATPLAQPLAPSIAPTPAKESDRGTPTPLNGVYPVAPASETSFTPATIDEQAHAAATSPKNDLPQPTDAQKDAGNYKVGRVSLHGLNISIENPKGSVRSGTSPDGSKWSNTLAAHYGYIRKSEGNDGDHVDAFIGPNPESTKVFVVDQVNKDKSFDEHKVILGTDSIEQADSLYHANYHAGWTGRGAITEMPLDQFKTWVQDGPKTDPVAKPVQPTASPQPASEPNAVGPAIDNAVSKVEPTATAQPESTIGDGAQSGKAVAKPKTPRERIKQNLQARSDYFTPGSIVSSYGGGHDEVLSYTTPDKEGRWSVRVHPVKKVGSEWVRIGKPQDARQHSTQPDARELKSGPVERLGHMPPSKVQYTEPRADGKPFPNAHKRGIAPDPAAAPATDPMKVPDDQQTSAADDSVDALTDGEAKDVAARMGKKLTPRMDAKDAIKQEHPDDIAHGIAGDTWNGQEWTASTVKTEDAAAAPTAKTNESSADLSAQPTAKIEDSGQVLEGARKLYAKAYASKLEEGMGMDTAAVPLSKSWPEPDYQRMLDDGADQPSPCTCAARHQKSNCGR